MILRLLLTLIFSVFLNSPFIETPDELRDGVYINLFCSSFSPSCLEELSLILTQSFPVGQKLFGTFPDAADRLCRDWFYVVSYTGGRGGYSPRRRFTVLSEPLQIEQRELLEEPLPVLFTQFRPELQDVLLTCAL